MPPEIASFSDPCRLRFILLKTAAVRRGEKPGELLRLYGSAMQRQRLVETVALPCLELQSGPGWSLALFYHPAQLAAFLSRPENYRLLRECGYPASFEAEAQLAHLRLSFLREKMPHEIGVFVGYPAKDVRGFMARRPSQPVMRGDWVVFGEAGESLARMRSYRRASVMAGRLLAVCKDLPSFFEELVKAG